jgi:hypothetical protein
MLAWDAHHLYAERARYSRVFKLIDIREYDRLFDQALRDHEAAVRLDPLTAENFFARGLTYYDRAWAVRQDNFGSPVDERYWPLAAEDFTKAIEFNGAREQAFDMRGDLPRHARDLPRTPPGIRWCNRRLHQGTAIKPASRRHQIG